ncbi:MAG: hypothetical protein KC422_24925 [Trueperaceae bacterium]|nr:hypothetical protein [Trueperaceae bacterium]
MKNETYSIITRSIISAGRFVKQPKGQALLAKCKFDLENPYCGVPAYAQGSMSNAQALADLEQRQEELDLIKAYLDKSDSWQEVFDDYADEEDGFKALWDAASEDLSEAKKELEKLIDQDEQKNARVAAQLLKDEAEEFDAGPRWIDSPEVDSLDVTGLEGEDARTFALLVGRWNPGIKQVYSKRNGKRYLTAAVTRIDLNHKLIDELGFRDELEALIKDKNIHVYRDEMPAKKGKKKGTKPAADPQVEPEPEKPDFKLEQESIEKPERISHEELSRQARVGAQAQNEQEGFGLIPSYDVGGLVQTDLFAQPSSRKELSDAEVTGLLEQWLQDTFKLKYSIAKALEQLHPDYRDNYELRPKLEERLKEAFPDVPLERFQKASIDLLPKYRHSKLGSKPEKKEKLKAPEAITTYVIDIDAQKDIPYRLAYDAHRGTSFVPEDRALQQQHDYALHLDSVFSKLTELAKEPEQRAVLPSVLQTYKDGYQKRYKANLESRSRIVSTMISGRGNFPVARMEKRNDVANKRLKELIDYTDYAFKRAQKQIANALPEEKQNAIYHDRMMQVLEKEAKDAIAMVGQIENGAPYYKSAFTNSLKGKLERAWKNGHYEPVKRALRYVKQHQGVNKGPVFAPNNRIWKYLEMEPPKPQPKKDEKQSISEGQNILDGYEVEVRRNDAKRGYEIEFDRKPDKATHEKLKAHGFRYSFRQGFYYAKQSNNRAMNLMQVLA